MAEVMKILGGHPYLVDEATGRIRPEPRSIAWYDDRDGVYRDQDGFECERPDVFESDFVDIHGNQYQVVFDSSEQVQRFEEELERFFLRHGQYPRDINRFFISEKFNPVEVNDPSHRRGANDMAIKHDRYGYSEPQRRSQVIDQEQREARRKAELATVDPTDQIRELLTSTGALPTSKPLAQMTRAEQARATATGLAQLVNLAAAELAAATEAERARGEEPPVGAVARFAKHFGSQESKQYNYTAIRVEKSVNAVDPHRGWHHSGVNSPVHLGSHLPNPCSWEELNEFADPESVEVGMEWAKGPEWSSWEAPAAEGEGSTNEQIITALHAGVTDAQRILSFIVKPGAATLKGDVKGALSKLDSALKAHDDLVVAASAAEDKTEGVTESSS